RPQLKAAPHRSLEERCFIWKVSLLRTQISESLDEVDHRCSEIGRTRTSGAGLRKRIANELRGEGAIQEHEARPRGREKDRLRAEPSDAVERQILDDPGSLTGVSGGKSPGGGPPVNPQDVARGFGVGVRRPRQSEVVLWRLHPQLDLADLE